MASKEGHAFARKASHANGVAWRPKGGLDPDFLQRFEAGHFVEAGSPDNREIDH